VEENFYSFVTFYVGKLLPAPPQLLSAPPQKFRIIWNTFNRIYILEIFVGKRNLYSGKQFSGREGEGMWLRKMISIKGENYYEKLFPK